MNEEELLAQAQAALQAGKSPEGVNARIAEVSGGRYRTLQHLQTAVRMAGELPGAAGRDTTAPGGVTPSSQSSAFRDYLRAAAQGATFGFADEIAGMLPGGDTEASRARMEQIRRDRPVGSFLAEAAGGMVVPGGSGAALGRSVIARGGSRLAAGALGGGAAAAMSGTLTGAGEADEGSRLAGGFFGGLVGGPIGAATGFGGALAGRAVNKIAGHTGEMNEFARTRVKKALEEAGVDPQEMIQRLQGIGEGSVVADLGENLGREARAAVNRAPALSRPGGPKSRIMARHNERGDRIANELRATSRLGRSFDESLKEAEELVDDVRRNYYKPLERLYPTVDGPNVAQALSDPSIARFARKVAPEAKGRAPTFRELQDIMMELRDEMTAARASGRPNRSKRAAEAFDQLIEAMEEDMPSIAREVRDEAGEVIATETQPGFRDAQRAFRIAAKRVEAHDLGRAAAFKEPRDIRRTMDALPEEAQDAFRMGMLDRWETALRERRAGGSRATQIIEGGQSMQDRMRLIVGEDQALQDLLKGLERESRWQATARALMGNSTTAQQQQDALAQMPQSVRAAAWKLATGVFGLSDEQRRAAAEMIGHTLLSEGETAAQILANDLAIRFSRTAGAGAAAGATAAREVSTSRGGLLDQ